VQPTAVRVQLLAIVDAVRTTGPDRWKDTTSHDSMRGVCAQLHEARDRHGQMLYRLYLRWQREHHRVVIVDGGAKPNSTTLPDSFYEDLAALTATANSTRHRSPPLTTSLGSRSIYWVTSELVPGGEEQARERLDAYLNPPKPIPTVAHTVAHDPENAETPVNTGVLKYRYRDSNADFRRERARGPPQPDSRSAPWLAAGPRPVGVPAEVSAPLRRSLARTNERPAEHRRTNPLSARRAGLVEPSPRCAYDNQGGLRLRSRVSPSLASRRL
jgi:hypothetical protein